MASGSCNGVGVLVVVFMNLLCFGKSFMGSSGVSAMYLYCDVCSVFRVRCIPIP